MLNVCFFVEIYPGPERSLGDLPVSVFLPGELHGQRNEVDYSPWGHKESETNEEL